MNKEEIINIIKKYVSGSKCPILNKAGIYKITQNIEEQNKIYSQRLHKILNEYENTLYNYLIEKLGNNFTAEELYNYMYDTYNKNNTKIISLSIGYEKLNIKDIIQNKSKKEIYEYICNNPHIYNLKIKIIKLLQTRYKDAKNIKTNEDLFLYLTNEIPQKCEICGNNTPFISFTKPYYKQFCCNKCRQIWWAKKQHENNTSYRMSSKTKQNALKLQSNTIKNKIKNGEWTPNVTNSWCHSKIKLKYNLNNKIISKNVRSSWEAFFQLLNPDLEYETLRILYYDTIIKANRNYIVDFIDNKNRIVYEIKPNGCKNTQNNIDKFNALDLWCKTNNYKMNIISEDYFQKHIFKISYLQYMENDQKEKLLKLLEANKFNIDYEN